MTLSTLQPLAGKVGIVTGGASGIGRAITEALTEAGATIVVWDQKPPSEQNLSWQQVDVTNPDSVSAALDDVVAQTGIPDFFFANAGIAAGRGPIISEGRLEHFSMSDWDKVMDVNLLGVLNCLRVVGGLMRQNRSGRIVVIGSTAGLRPDPMVSYAYVASKSAAIAVAKQAALDLAPDGVTVNVIAPGPFKTGIGGERANSEQSWAETVPLRRVGNPEEIAPLALLLASDASSYMTGAVYMADGGAMLQLGSLSVHSED